jgi:oligopeptide transport system ATP-binding protein
VACHLAETLPPFDVVAEDGISPLAARRMALYAAAKARRAE